MKPRQHLTYSSVAVAAALPFIGRRRAALFWLSSIIIDADHWLAFWWYFDNPSLADALAMVRGTLDRPMPPKRGWKGEGFRAAHTFAFIAPFVALGAFIPDFRAISSGFLFHVLLDRIDDRQGQRVRAVVFARDEESCRRCGGSALFGNRRAWALRSVYQGGTYTADNLITLCRPCFVLIATNTAEPRGLPLTAVA